jgi:hypothetical protein
MEAKCRHCHKKVAARGYRGLCRSCYRDPNIKTIYKPRSKRYTAAILCRLCGDPAGAWLDGPVCSDCFNELEFDVLPPMRRVTGR